MGRFGVRLVSKMGYSINEEFIESESSDKYYFMGYFLGDGTLVSTFTNYVRVDSMDYDVLSSIRDRAGGVIKERVDDRYPDRRYYYWYLTSEKFAEALKSKGICDSKSITGCNITGVPEEYFSDFVRGVFDSDGCASGRNVSIYGHISYIEEIYLFLLRNGIKCSIYHDINKNGNGLTQVKVWKNSISAFYTLLWKDNSMCMSRKKRNIEEFLYGKS